MDEAGVSKSLISAWVAPHRVMISNDEVARFVQGSNRRLVGVGSVDISRPMTAVRDIRQVGHTGPLMPSELGRPIPYIYQIAVDFPELTIVGGHIGYP